MVDRRRYPQRTQLNGRTAVTPGGEHPGLTGMIFDGVHRFLTLALRWRTRYAGNITSDRHPRIVDISQKQSIVRAYVQTKIVSCGWRGGSAALGGDLANQEFHYEAGISCFRRKDSTRANRRSGRVNSRRWSPLRGIEGSGGLPPDHRPFADEQQLSPGGAISPTRWDDRVPREPPARRLSRTAFDGGGQRPGSLRHRFQPARLCESESRSLRR